MISKLVNLAPGAHPSAYPELILFLVISFPINPNIANTLYAWLFYHKDESIIQNKDETHAA